MNAESIDVCLVHCLRVSYLLSFSDNQIQTQVCYSGDWLLSLIVAYQTQTPVRIIRVDPGNNLDYFKDINLPKMVNSVTRYHDWSAYLAPSRHIFPSIDTRADYKNSLFLQAITQHHAFHALDNFVLFELVAMGFWMYQCFAVRSNDPSPETYPSTTVQVSGSNSSKVDLSINGGERFGTVMYLGISCKFRIQSIAKTHNLDHR